jgi:AcrR family transcriptional regulator
MTTPRLEERALRADAQRNLARILEAAREVFAKEGIEATVADVAERAGVGTATIFRRFPTKDDLIAAVVEQRLENVARQGREALAGKNAMKGLHQLMRSGIESYVRDRSFCESIGTAVFERPILQELKAELDATIQELLARAKKAGDARKDVTPTDISMLFFAVASAALKLEPAQRDAWHHYLDIVFDGLRPAAARR